MTAYAREHEAEFVEMVTKRKRAELDRSLRDGKRELEQAQARIRKLDEIIQRQRHNRLLDYTVSPQRLKIPKLHYLMAGWSVMESRTR